MLCLLTSCLALWLYSWKRQWLCLSWDPSHLHLYTLVTLSFMYILFHRHLCFGFLLCDFFLGHARENEVFIFVDMSIVLQLLKLPNAILCSFQLRIVSFKLLCCCCLLHVIHYYWLFYLLLLFLLLMILSSLIYPATIAHSAHAYQQHEESKRANHSQREDLWDL